MNPPPKMKRCEHCGAEYLDRFHSHCTANFHNHARQTELLGRYVERAEKAEAEVLRLMAWIEGYPCACPKPPASCSTSAILPKSTDGT